MSVKRKGQEDSQAENGSEILIYQTEEGQTKLQVRLQDESVWLTQQLMAELFQTTRQNISLLLHPARSLISAGLSNLHQQNV